MFLYLFITCQKNYPASYKRIKDMMHKLGIPDYCLVVGGYLETNYLSDSKTLQLNCNDYYEGLPEKVVKTYAFIDKCRFFRKYKFICKLDDDMIILKTLPCNLKFMYCGVVQRKPGRRNWHIGKCSENSRWNKQIYKGYFVPWCKGGYGYIIAKTLLSNFSFYSNYQKDIYEDLCVAKILDKNNIRAHHFGRIDKFLVSPDHSVN